MTRQFIEKFLFTFLLAFLVTQLENSIVGCVENNLTIFETFDVGSDRQFLHFESRVFQIESPLKIGVVSSFSSR